MKSREDDIQLRTHTSERRQATVMFADISGFTSMSEKLDHEEVTSIMNDCFDLLGYIIKDYGGTIDKFIGDCIMAVFGVPKAIENAPKRAIAAAVEMRNKLKQFNKERKLSIPLDIHIGINSGEVLAGEVGTSGNRAYTVMGDAVNLASRLEDASEPGQILVGPLTYRYAHAGFRFGQLKPISVKGKEQPVQVYEVQGVSQSVNENDYGVRGSADRMIQSELVGRDKERNRLELQIMKVINGEGSVVNLIGEAGVGKSRLSAEVFGESFMDRVTLLEGRALSSGRTLSYYPVIGIIKNWASITEDDTYEQTKAKLEDAVNAAAPEQADEIIPFVATMMGIPLEGKYAERMKNVSGDSLSKLIAKNLRDLLAAVGRGKPLLVVVEDLHWADESSLDMLKSLVPVVEKHPVMFLFAFRPDYTETTEQFHTDLLESHAELCIDIILSALTAEQSGILARNLLKIKGIPKKITDRIIERSGGNPFFIEEVVRSFIDFGYIQSTEDGFAVADDLENISIPNSINEVIMSRVDSLDEQMRSLLRIASVIGRNFFHRILAELLAETGMYKQPLEETLAALKQLQFIRERTRMEEVEYLFKHALAQEAVYNSILLRERKKLHLAAGHAVERAFADRLDEFYGVLAMHFLKGEDFDKAEVYVEKAGEAALNSSASKEAITYYQQAVELYRNKHGEQSSSERLAELEKNIALAYWRRTDRAQTIAWCDRVLDYLRQNKRGLIKWRDFVLGFFAFFKWVYLPDRKRQRKPSRQDEVIFELGYTRIFALFTGNYREYKEGMVFSFSWLRRALYFGSTILQKYFRILELLNMTPSLLHMKQLAKRVQNKIYDLVYDENSNNLFIFSELWNHLALGFGSPSYSPEVFRYFVSIGDFFHANYYAGWLSMILFYRGQFDKMRNISHEVKTVADDYQNWSLFSTYQVILSYYYLGSREFKRANEYSRKAVALWEQEGLELNIPIILSISGRSLINIDELEKAKYIVERLREFLKNSKSFPFSAAPAYITITAYFCKLKDKKHRGISAHDTSSDSKSHLKLMLKNSKRYIHYYPEACHYAGIWYWQAGRIRKAEKWWMRGLEKAEKLGMKLEIARLNREIGRRMLDRHVRGKSRRLFNGRSAEQFLQTARIVFQEIGLEKDVQETERLLEQL